MAVLSNDLLVIERSGTLYKTPVSDLPAGGGDFVRLQQEVVSTGVNAIDFDLPAGYTGYRLIPQGLTLSAGYSIFRFSDDGGLTFISTLTHRPYMTEHLVGSTSTTVSNGDGDSGITFTAAAKTDINGRYDIIVSSGQASIFGEYTGENSTDRHYGRGGGFVDTTGVAEALRMTFFSGANTYTAGTVTLYGYKEP